MGAKANTTPPWRDLTFEGHSAIVTGGARGIGRAIVHRLAGLGARVELWDVDGDQARRTAAELVELLAVQERPSKVGWARVDVTDLDAVLAATDRFAAEGLHVLINNAGTTSVQDSVKMPLEIWDRTLHINLYGTYYCCRAAAPHLTRSLGASIVNISSSSALVGGGGGAHYAASKAGIDGLTRHLARELAPNVRVNSVQPRTIETDLFRTRYAHAPEEEEKVKNMVVLRRLGQPEDIADVVAFLASNWASFVTGQILLVDGGRTYQ